MEPMGIKAKYLEILSLWPLHADAVKEFIDSCDVVHVAEYSAGAQLRGLIQREATGPLPKLKSLLRYDGRLMTPDWIIEKVK
jgi:pyruvate/2-oxoacid:ferredoxin oxidoreductase alpha subunit